MAAVLELHERRETLTDYSKALRSLGVESDAVSVSCAVANDCAFDGYALVLLVAASQGDAASLPAVARPHGRMDLRPLLLRCASLPVLGLVDAAQYARQCEWFDCGVHALLRTPVARWTLAAQIRALLRLAPRAMTTTHLHPHLTRIERRVLELLASEPGRPFSRGAILAHIYDDHRVVCPRTVDAHIKNLRRKLTVAPGGATVKSVYGEGYVFECDGRIS